MTAKVTIRTMHVKDADAVNALTKQLGYAISVEQTKINIEAIANNKYCEAFVAVFKNEVVAWVTVASVVTLESLPFSEIRGLVVDEQVRGKNIGRLLIDEVKQWCYDKKLERLRIKCNVLRKEAHAFYLHLGFIEKKEQKIFELTV